MKLVLVVCLDDAAETVFPKIDDGFDVPVPLRYGIVLEGIVAFFNKVFPGLLGEVFLKDLKTEVLEAQDREVVLDGCLA
jgi:hypothetical protein